MIVLSRAQARALRRLAERFGLPQCDRDPMIAGRVDARRVLDVVRQIDITQMRLGSHDVMLLVRVKARLLEVGLMR